MKTIEREKRNGVIYRKGHGTVVVPPFHSIVFIRFDQRASAEHTRGEKEREPCRLNQETNEMLGNSRGCIDFTRPRVRERKECRSPATASGEFGGRRYVIDNFEIWADRFGCRSAASICRDPRASVAEILGVIRGKSGCAWIYRMDRSPSDFTPRLVAISKLSPSQERVHGSPFRDADSFEVLRRLVDQRALFVFRGRFVGIQLTILIY